MSKSNSLILFFIFLIVFDVFVWKEILFNSPSKNAGLYFLDVGQGDSELIILPNNVKVLIDGGPNNRILSQLDSILSPFDRYFDLVVLSHPQADHFTGLIDVLKRYKIGAFISSGQEGTAQSFKDLEKIIKENKIPTVALIEGSRINYLNSHFDILSPSKDLLSSADLNNWGLVIKMADDKIKALFTADADSKIEKSLISKYGVNLDVDILKVAHHGSKFSSDEKFLYLTSPKIAVIEVGHNSYGHPTKEVLSRLSSIGVQIFRTDTDGTIKLAINNQEISIFKKK